MFAFGTEDDEDDTPFFENEETKPSIFSLQSQQEESAFNLFNAHFSEKNSHQSEAIHTKAKQSSSKKSKKSIIEELDEFDRRESFIGIERNLQNQEEFTFHYNSKTQGMMESQVREFGNGNLLLQKQKDGLNNAFKNNCSKERPQINLFNKRNVEFPQLKSADQLKSTDQLKSADQLKSTDNKMLPFFIKSQESIVEEPKIKKGSKRAFDFNFQKSKNPQSLPKEPKEQSINKQEQQQKQTNKPVVENGKVKSKKLQFNNLFRKSRATSEKSEQAGCIEGSSQQKGPREKKNDQNQTDFVLRKSGADSQPQKPKRQFKFKIKKENEKQIIAKSLNSSDTAKAADLKPLRQSRKMEEGVNLNFSLKEELTKRETVAAKINLQSNANKKSFVFPKKQPPLASEMPVDSSRQEEKTPKVESSKSAINKSLINQRRTESASTISQTQDNLGLLKYHKDIWEIKQNFQKIKARELALSNSYAEVHMMARKINQILQSRFANSEASIN